MGFGLPSAIGAWFADKSQEVWAIVGDGGFQMTACELSTAVQEGANVKVAIMNNSYLGMVRQWQEFFFEKRYSAVNMLSPDFVKLADAHGIPARRITKRDEVAAALKWARETPGPVVLEFRVEQEEGVYPMVTTGSALHEMIRRPKRNEQLMEVKA
jgi:acetolactate synthase-1/2/3 large subunit